MNMEFEKIGAINFYDMNNELIGSIGTEAEGFTEEGLMRTAHTAMMDVFSEEEAERIAYFKHEVHFIRVGKAVKETGLKEPVSYAAKLSEAGMIELHEKVHLKLKAISTLKEVMVWDDTDRKKEMDALIESMLLDLDIAVLDE